jgi:hypothetical protein
MRGSVLERLKERQKRLGPALYAAVLSLIVLTLSGAVGILTHLPWLFPSLGPTVMLFFESPSNDLPDRSTPLLDTESDSSRGLVASTGSDSARYPQRLPED